MISGGASRLEETERTGGVSMPRTARQHRSHSRRLAVAAITGLFAGAARALTDWFLGHLT